MSIFFYAINLTFICDGQFLRYKINWYYVENGGSDCDWWFGGNLNEGTREHFLIGENNFLLSLMEYDNVEICVYLYIYGKSSKAHHQNFIFSSKIEPTILRLIRIILINNIFMFYSSCFRLRLYMHMHYMRKWKWSGNSRLWH